MNFVVANWTEISVADFNPYGQSYSSYNSFKLSIKWLSYEAENSSDSSQQGKIL